MELTWRLLEFGKDDLPLHFERDLPPACARKGTLGAFELDELKYLLDMHENEVSTRRDYC